jgi:UDP-N-acetylmuramoyl-L-alanyl-D-glutamate--2,6-diaminopimelate ligase
MELRKLLAVLEEVQVIGDIDFEVQDIAYHAAQVKPGSCFVAVRGQCADGHDYVNEAVRRGAAVVVSEKPVKVPSKVTNVVVHDARDALARLSTEYFSNPSLNMKLVGVTGTNGKTTVTYMLEAIFAAAGFIPGVIGTVEYRYGKVRKKAEHTTPESYELQKLLSDMVGKGVDACAMEVSSHALDMGRVVGCHFDGAIFTNLSEEHLDYHGEMEAYFASKAVLFEHRLVTSHKGNVFAVINADDPYGRRLVGSVHVPIWRYGIDEKADVSCSLKMCDERGLDMIVNTPRGQANLRSRLMGRFNALNILGAIAAGLAMGIDLSTAVGAIEAVEKVPGRLESVPNDRDILAFVDYAHTPDALKNVLLQARGLAKGRLIVVFGCGGDRDRAKRPLMGKAVAEAADIAVVTNDNPRTEDPQAIIDMILPGIEDGAMKGYEVILDRKDAIAKAVEIAKAGDVIVVAGKGHEDYQIVGTKKKHFDDREALEDLLK